ncbi:GNAT family N-acetyltransferase [Algoriphagus aquimarinus]|uniref:GNAT family N-acetyltransferase n=1 Tax=Algoriphagus aquimarinus TaxID=237018 RepID=A0A5C7ARN7_9BACT|nr:GNAT family N-acetyltransferase [Algoriphagus aquimarinus]TXE11330.1 GNAT family N-acetyltransferase [Algoriphagus aquimarinus]|tara:strand:+ start:1712 stop:2395 length:684 start_codon:yes stop_codon:yes gene_type:complete
MDNISFQIIVANASHKDYSTQITDEMENSAKARGTGIAKRSPAYVETKMEEGKAVIALTSDGKWAGFCYIEAWGHGKYVANSGLIVSPEYRKYGLARKIKNEVFKLSRLKYPDSNIFGLTTGAAVMKINSELGYIPVSYSDLTDDNEFWKGCQSCVNYEILMSKNRQNCLCTAMLYDPNSKRNHTQELALRDDFKKDLKLFDRWVRLKKYVMLKLNKSKDTLTSIFL